MDKTKILHTRKIYTQPHISVIEEEFEEGFLAGSIENGNDGTNIETGDDDPQRGESKSIFGSIWDDEEEDDDYSLW